MLYVSDFSMGSNGLYTRVSLRPNLARVGMILYKSVSVSEFSTCRNDIIQECLCV